MFVALLAAMFSIAITVQTFPAEDAGHMLTASAGHAADIAWSQPGTQDTKDDCGASIHCHHASAVLPVVFLVGDNPVDEPVSPAIVPRSSWLAKILAPPPRSV